MFELTAVTAALAKRAAVSFRTKTAVARWRSASGLAKLLGNIPTGKLRNVHSRGRALEIVGESLGLKTGKGLEKLIPEIDGMRDVLPRMIRQERRIGESFREPSTLYRGTRFMDPLITRTKNFKGEKVPLASPLWSVAHGYMPQTQLGRVMTVLRNRRGSQHYAPDYSHVGHYKWDTSVLSRLRDERRNSRYGNFWDSDNSLVGYGPRTTQDVSRTDGIQKYFYETPITHDNPVLYRAIAQGDWTDAKMRRIPNNPRWNSILKQLLRAAPPLAE